MLYDVNAATWSAGGLFFGLWLIPMGWLALRSGLIPTALGWILVVGGVGYILSTFVSFLAPGASGLAGALPLLATVGEVWMVAYLLIKGMPQGPAVQDRPAPEVAVA